jgi:DNA-directed RNA polymerase sigma subunit (sigma70/sigma32)
MTIAELSQIERTALVNAAADQADDPRSAHDLAVEFGVNEEEVRQLQRDLEVG